MRILGVETSCDDTGIAILEVDENQNFKILANLVASQIKVHKKYGGVFPAMAKREHQKNLAPTLISALKESKLLKNSANKITKENQKNFDDIFYKEPELNKKITSFLKKYAKPDIDAIAVTNGPGLEPCLWTGVNFARALSYFWNLPLIDVNHIESHILVNLLQTNNCSLQVPALGLVVSGGHTQIVLVKKFGKYEILGETRDDAAGECFDKCAKILGLGYPGGPVISKLAEKHKNNMPLIRSNNGNEFDIKLPRPMEHSGDYDFSFSGLKTATLYLWQKINDRQKTAQRKRAVASEIQQAIIDVLIKKTIKAVKDYNVKTLILGGGVTANQELRKQMEKKLADELPNAKFLVPSPNLSTDNGLMVAVAGYFKAKKNGFSNWKTLEADANLRVE